MRFFIYLFIINYFNQINAQSDVPLTLRSQFNGPYGYTIIGNTHNEADNWFQNPPPPCQMLTESSATLNLLPNQNVVAAYLYWGGIGDGTQNPTIKLNGINYNSSQISIGYPDSNTFSSYFGCFKDISNQVINTGSNVYTFSNLDLNPIISNYCSNAIYYSCWYVVVVYEQLNLENQQLNIYDGLNVASEYFNNGTTSLIVNNLNVIENQNAKMTYIALNGSPNNFYRESIQFNNNILSNEHNPADNPFNGTNSFTGSTNNWNQDIDTFDISQYINVGDTQANIIFNSFLFRTLQTVITSIRSELPDATTQIKQVSGQTICGNRNLLVDYTVFNTNSNASLPANVPVSFYADNVLLQTVNTPSSIAIGGSLALQTTVVIPAAIPNNFILKAIVNNNAANQAPTQESNLNNNNATQNITLLDAPISVVFSLPNSFCVGATMPILPIISNNSIAGTWSPSVIDNQNGGSYVFTPAIGQCASSFIFNVTITPSANPTFTLQNTYCQGEIVPILPIMSNENISGTWSPNVINNQISRSYVFTPNAGQCAGSFTLNVSILNNITLTFTLQNTFCQGEIVPILPIMSNENISGTWSPNIINNQNNGSYVFTPNAGQCASSFTLNVNISPNRNTSFSLQNNFCQGEIVPILPLVSDNNISGSWSPNAIDNQNSGSYIFTPNVGLCAKVLVLDVAIESEQTTVQYLSICKDENGNFSIPTILISGLNQGDFNFLWKKDNVVINYNTTTISVLNEGKYNLIASDISSGCQQNFEFIVTSIQPITAKYTVSDDFDLNQTIAVDAIGGEPPYFYSFNNLPFQNDSVFNVYDGGDILVKTKDNSSCYEISKVLTLWQYPRFFTPNNDGFNDNWGINTFKNIQVNLYDRFGKLIKQLKNKERWDGTFNNQPLTTNDYWFVVYYENKIFKGHFSLKR